MKKFEEIINQTSVYLHNWNEKIDVIGDFENVYLTGNEYRLEESPYPNKEFFFEKREK